MQVNEYQFDDILQIEFGKDEYDRIEIFPRFREIKGKIQSNELFKHIYGQCYFFS